MTFSYNFYFTLIILLFEQNGQTALDIARDGDEHEIISIILKVNYYSH